MMKSEINLMEVDSVEIISLQDNYIEVTAQDNTAVVSRVSPLKDGELSNSILAEHGFSALVRTTAGDSRHTILFDFGFSPEGAAYNAKAMNLPMNEVEMLALSHGHSDHTGGLAALRQLIDRKNIQMVCHPMAFTTHRYLEPLPEFKVHLPALTREALVEQDIELVETEKPFLLSEGHALFLGEIPRTNDFEKGFPIARRERDGTVEWDPIEDDSAMVMHVRGKGLVVLSGCSHAGIVNTVNHAKNITGIEKVHVVMGGFHLSGPLFEPILERTTDELLALDPDYVVPCHCTGRKSTAYMEQTMPDRFILNMSGTKLTFRA